MHASMKQTVYGLFLLLLLSGCRSTYNADPMKGKELAGEGRVVVVRPRRYTLLGTQSMRDYLEVVYEEMSENAAGYPVVRLGLRNKGGEHWWDLRGPDFTLFAQAVFYSQPVEGQAARGAPLYRTNRQGIPMKRGETSDITFTCPVKGARGYQIILSEE